MGAGRARGPGGGAASHSSALPGQPGAPTHVPASQEVALWQGLEEPDKERVGEVE